MNTNERYDLVFELLPTRAAVERPRVPQKRAGEREPLQSEPSESTSLEAAPAESAPGGTPEETEPGETTAMGVEPAKHGDVAGRKPFWRRLFASSSRVVLDITPEEFEEVLAMLGVVRSKDGRYYKRHERGFGAPPIYIDLEKQAKRRAKNNRVMSSFSDYAKEHIEEGK